MNKRVFIKTTNPCIGHFVFRFLIIITFFPSCKKFLDAKPDKALTSPETLQDLRGLLDNDGRMNRYYPNAGQISCDDYYVTDADFASSTLVDQRENYNWLHGYKDDNWSYTYQRIANVNVVLDNVDKVRLNGEPANERNTVKGAALFIRGFSTLLAAQVYTVPYNALTADTEPGLPLKLTSDINEPVVRGSLEQVYEQIINDFTYASKLLPVSSNPVTRPNRAAAYGALAYTFLLMQDYDKAGNYADSSLMLYNTLIDYNTLNAADADPFTLFNSEVVFQASIISCALLSLSKVKVDTFLYNSYDADDLRKILFFKDNGNGTFTFKGNYEGKPNAALFCGVATDELYLIKAECLARSGNIDSAMDILNQLLATRWKTGTFVPFDATSPHEALTIILTERRKELCIRGGRRWADLRRLNQNPGFEITLIRIINGQTYTLAPNSPRYAFLIPQTVIDIAGIEQNRR